MPEEPLKIGGNLLGVKEIQMEIHAAIANSDWICARRILDHMNKRNLPLSLSLKNYSVVCVLGFFFFFSHRKSICSLVLLVLFVLKHSQCK